MERPLHETIERWFRVVCNARPGIPVRAFALIMPPYGSGKCGPCREGKVETFSLKCGVMEVSKNKVIVLAE
ncbi:MAG: hypothetical protein JST38_02240 [Bacteroidetes bacterium]|nr:hypothetical protein [Bacteroidota bacterium]MBS1939682.1 hypothetical protein [Bacteroidota bacterium]